MNFFDRSFLFSANEGYIESLHAQFQADPLSVGAEWREFFQELGGGLRQAPVWSEKAPHEVRGGTAGSPLPDGRGAEEALAEAWRTWGHTAATLDPLGLQVRQLAPELKALCERAEGAGLKAQLDFLRRTYGGTLTLEFPRSSQVEEWAWLREVFEAGAEDAACGVGPEARMALFEGLVRADHFEKFLGVKFPGAKRFGLEGGDSLLPGLQLLVARLGLWGVEQVVFGMAHRGRLNVMTGLLGFSLSDLFRMFRGTYVSSHWGSGDVKYHLGAAGTYPGGGKPLTLRLLDNPSHLEAVDAVVLGAVKALQETQDQGHTAKVLGVLIHGDASFAGQGVVMETLQMSRIPGYDTGGTLHIVLNNQVGFTATPQQSRSGPYPTDVARLLDVPIIHVNGDDVEAVARAFLIAGAYRQKFRSDIVVDVVCYRRHGHNETDEPSFTQPRMYRAIAQHPIPRERYAETCMAAGILPAQLSAVEGAVHREFVEAFEASAAVMPVVSVPRTFPGSSPTGIDNGALKAVGQALTRVPEGFHLHTKLLRFVEGRAAMLEGTVPLDWSMGEALALGSLVREGRLVRLSGQDSGRGTFTQRHGVWVDQETENCYIPLNYIDGAKGRLDLLSSPLSEYGVLGFETGYSLMRPQSLVLWEAQFGDFANGAQIMIDQYLASGGTKWGHEVGLVMLLPHGYEGQGPEHSSARLERFLQLAAEDNMVVANCTTPANYFHLLRRQALSAPKRPLIVMTPKSLLRHKKAVSALGEIAEGTTFAPVIGDPQMRGQDSKTQRVILCSGKVYYDLLDARRDGTPLIRIEQLYPFPEQDVRQILQDYETRGRVLVWAQEEPANQGAFGALRDSLMGLKETLGFESLVFAGRSPSASPATGFMGCHLAEQDRLVHEALGQKKESKQ